MGADLYESYVGSVISTAALAVAAGLGLKGVAIPMALAALGVLASIGGTFFVKTREDATQKNLLKALRKGVDISAVLIVVLAFPVIRFLLPEHMGIYGAVISGLIAGVAIGLVDVYKRQEVSSPYGEAEAPAPPWLYR